MTDKDIADRVYIEPLTVEVVEQLIKKERRTVSFHTWRTGRAESGDGAGRSRLPEGKRCASDRNDF